MIKTSLALHKLSSIRIILLFKEAGQGILKMVKSTRIHFSFCNHRLLYWWEKIITIRSSHTHTFESTFLEMAAMPFHCNDILLIQGNLGYYVGWWINIQSKSVRFGNIQTILVFITLAQRHFIIYFLNK